MTTDKIKIEIWSDIVCPFCYVGKKKIEQAIAKHNAQDKVNIIWYGFQLDPDFPADSTQPSLQYLSQKKGIPKGRLQQMQQYLNDMAKPYGISFNSNASKVFNTSKAHQLIQWAQTQGSGSELKEVLMRAYFTDGVDLSKDENLYDLVEEVGLERSKAEQVLKYEDYYDTVSLHIQKAQQLGIRGVPFFLINEKTALSGAQPDGFFERVILDALDDLESSVSAKDGEFCAIDEDC